ncbi:MAG: sugar phosphorylase [Chloroflexi bacterium]|nr:sugar phosphorylase [Chloroflexota bacterium]
MALVSSAALEEPRARILQALTRLYGSDAAQALLPRILELAQRHAAARKVPRPAGWSERDALLITYADQAREDGRPPLATLAQVCREHLAGLISGIHLLPFYPSSSDDGFSVVDYRQVDPAYGTWADVAELARDHRLMFDAVVNHASAGSAWFQAFLRQERPYADFFITPPEAADLSTVIRPRTSPLLTSFATTTGERRVWTTFSADQVDLNYANPQVLLEVLEVLLFYASQGAGLLRLDAVAFLWKEPGTACLHLPQTHAILRLFRAVLDLAAPHVLLVTETNVPHAENVSYFGDGRGEAHMVYNFALPPLVLDAIARGSAGTLTQWAATLAAPGEQTTFFNFLASHDGIGLNPARGLIGDDRILALVERALAHGGRVSMKQGGDGSAVPYELNISYFDALSDPRSAEPLSLQVERFMAAQAVMLCLAGVPGIYFHSLFGSRGWPEGVQAMGRARTINRQKLERPELERELRDPGSLRARVFARFARLLRARRASPAFHPSARQTLLSLDDPLFAVLREDRQAGEAVLCLHNLSNRRVSAVPGPFLGGERAGRPWRELTSEAGSLDLRGAIEIEPYQVRWLQRQGGPIVAEEAGPRPPGPARDGAR